MQFQGKDFPKYTYGMKCFYYFCVIYLIYFISEFLIFK